MYEGMLEVLKKSSNEAGLETEVSVKSQSQQMKRQNSKNLWNESEKQVDHHAAV
jgi:hypothetical protein